MDKELYGRVTTMERKRQEVIYELIASEIAHVQDMADVVLGVSRLSGRMSNQNGLERIKASVPLLHIHHFPFLLCRCFNRIYPGSFLQGRWS